MGLKRLSTALAALLLFSAGTALGAELSGRSSTQLLWYNDDFTQDRVFEAAQYLRVNVTKVDKDNKLSFFFYGRGAQTIGEEHDLTGRVYYLYADYRDLLDKADIRFGRQFASNASGSVVMDGLKVDLKNIGPVGVSAFYGRDVVFGLTGELGKGWNSDLGVSAYLTGFKNTDAEISWLRQYDDSEVNRDIIGGSFKQNLFNSTKLYGNTKYDLFSEAFIESLIGLKFFPTSNLVFTGEYYSSYPTFDATSFYSVFAVDKFKEGLVRADYTVSDMLTVYGGYKHQWYDGDDEDHADVYQLGTIVTPIPDLRLTLEGDSRTGYSDNMYGFLADVDFRITKSSQIACGMSYDVYDRDTITKDEIARRYWCGGKHKFAKNIALSGRVQNDVNARYHENVSGRVVLDYDF